MFAIVLPVTDRAGAGFRVLSFNIRNGRAFDGWNTWWFRRRAVAQVLRTLDADVAGLQEVYRFQQHWLLRAAAGYEAAGRGRDRGDSGERCPVFVKASRLAVTAATTRWFSSQPDDPGSRLPGASFPRIATLLEVVDRDRGRDFGIANVHLDERWPSNRLESLKLLLSWLDPRVPWVVLGDFNATPQSDELLLMADAGYTGVLTSGAPGTAHDFTGKRDGRRIDHVLVREGEWSVEDAWVVTDRVRGRLPSDHWPVVADLVLLRDVRPPPER